MDERGSTTVFGIMIIMITAMIMLALLGHKMELMENLKNKQDLLLCTKYINGETQKYINHIEKSNVALVAATAASYSPVPIVNSVARATITGLKIFQHAKRIFLFKNIFLPKVGKCHLLGATIPSIYKPQALKFKRGLDNQTIIRKKKWKLFTKNKHGLIINSFEKTSFGANIKTYLLPTSGFNAKKMQKTILKMERPY